MKRLLIFLLGLPCLVWAQGASLDALAELESEEPELRRYTVEVIIFAYAEDVHVGSEVFEPDVVLPLEFFEGPVADDSVPIFGDRQDEPVELDAGPHPDLVDAMFEFEVLDRDKLELVETRRRLSRLDAYEPLMHIAWTQTTIAEELTPALELDRLGRVPKALDGSLKLYLSRYLHLVVDVSLAASAEADPLRYDILEDRILKNGETRYYDHPKFGVIAKVARVEDDTSDEIPGAESGTASVVTE